jgi:hypothetical protein
VEEEVAEAQAVQYSLVQVLIYFQVVVALIEVQVVATIRKVEVEEVLHLPIEMEMTEQEQKVAQVLVMAGMVEIINNQELMDLYLVEVVEVVVMMEIMLVQAPTAK